MHGVFFGVITVDCTVSRFLYKIHVPTCPGGLLWLAFILAHICTFKLLVCKDIHTLGKPLALIVIQKRKLFDHFST